MSSSVSANEYGRLPRWMPSQHALATSAKVAVVLLAPVAITWWLAGVDAAVLCLLVVAITVSQAAMSYGPWQSIFVLLTAAVAVVGSVMSREAVGIAVFVAVAALLTFLGNRVSAGALSLLPVLAVLLGLGVVPLSGWTALAVTLLTGAYTVIAVRLARLRLPLRPVSNAVAIQHAVVLAVLCGVVTYLVATFNWPHGYWVVVTLAVVLRPSVRETRSVLRDRIVGTVVGSLIAVAVGSLIPDGAVWLIVVAAAWFQIAYTIAGRYVASTIMTSVLVILAVAPAISGGVFTAAWERMGWTMLGVFLAVTAGILMSDPEPEPAV